MRRKSIWLFIAAIGFMFVFGDMASSYAQEGEAEFTLEEIVVTAEKREENIQKTSVSISVLTAEEIENKSMKSVSDMLQNVIGLQLQSAGSNTQIFIRGIGMNNLDTAYGDPAVSLNVDGVQQSRGIALSNSMMDVERIEVLRGPQGTLYGKNSTGGTVNVVMAQPKDTFETAVKASVGNYDARTYEAMVNVPVYSKLALRVSGVKDKRDGYMTGVGATGSQDTSTARLKALYKSSDDLNLTGTVEYRRDDSTGGFASVPVSNLNKSDPWNTDEESSSGSSGQSTNYTDSWTYTLNLNWNIMDWTKFTFIPTYTDYESHTSGQVELYSAPTPYPSNDQYSYEARFSNPDDSTLIWTLGGNYQDSTVEQYVPSYIEGTHVNQMNRPTGSWGLFGQATYPFSEKFRTVLGARYSYDDRKQEYEVYTADEDGELISTTGIKSVDLTASKPTWKIGFEYDVAEDSMAYIQAASGYKSGGVTFGNVDEDGNFTNYDAITFDEETSIAYELGSKNRFLNNRLQVNGDVFVTAYNGAQVQMNKIVNAGEDTEEWLQLIDNAGRSFMYGVELETTWLVTANDNLTIGLSSMKGEYNDLTIEEDVQGSPWQDAVDNEGAVMDDLPMANLPRFNLQLGYQHTFDLAEYGVLTTNFNTNYKTKYYNTVMTYVDGAKVPAHHISDFYVNWTSPTGMWLANAYVKNIENKAVAVMAQSARDGGESTVMLNAPRTFGVSLKIRY